MDTKIAEVANLPIPELKERLADFDAAELKALRAYEASTDTGQNRKGALEAIDEALAQHVPEAIAAEGETGEPAADAPPAWHAAEYDGPLTIPQAAWRTANIKPVVPPSTKPVTGVRTK